MQRFLLLATGFAAGQFYRITRLGSEVPEDGPVILVGNHPNGLVDPVVLASTTDRPVHFLGKAPLFDMPGIGSIMRGLGALPVYRTKDGADTAQNEATFEAVFAALRKGDLICLFPEGVSHSEPQLQTLKTGAARMALGAEAGCDFELGVRVVPVGLVYRSKRRFRSAAATWIGAPIEVRDLAALYGTDEREAVRRLTERIADGLREVTLEVEAWEDLPLLDLARKIWRGESDEHAVVRVKAFAEGVRELRERSPKEVDELGFRIACFGERLARLGVTVADLDVRYTAGGVLRFVAYGLLTLFVGLPIALVGSVFWILPYRLVAIATRAMKPERDVSATVQIISGIVFFPLWILAATLVTWAWLGWPWAIAVAVLSPLVGLYALGFWEWRREKVADASIFFRLGRRKSLKELLRRQRDELAEQIEALREELASGLA